MSWGAVGLQCGGRDGKAAERKWRKISRIRRELLLRISIVPELMICLLVQKS